MNEPTTYRKKPVEVQAWIVSDDQDDNDNLLAWLGDSADLDDYDDIEIYTLEGTMTARTGDYIIRGVQGEFYPCKPDIFAATYEQATHD